MPVSLGQFQPGTILSFLQVIVRWSICSKVEQVLLYLGMLHEGHKRANLFAWGLGTRNPQSGVLHEGRKRADRSLRGSALGNKYRLLADLCEHLLQSGVLQEYGRSYDLAPGNTGYKFLDSTF